MVDIHYFIFVINADTAFASLLVFGLAIVGLWMVYRMWKGSQRCPHCGELYRAHQPVVVQQPERTLPTTLWT